MIRSKFCLLLLATVALSGCKKSDASGSSSGGKFDLAESAPADPLRPDQPIKISLSQIAYTYSLGFSLPPDQVSAVQNRHIALCDRLGQAKCQVLNMQANANEGRSDGGSLKLRVAAALARSFQASLSTVVEHAGGQGDETHIEGEDLSKQIIDTEARLRSKQVLADRLMLLLKTRSGPVADLVEAERQVASVQEEIDAAQSELADARGRVAMSTFDISYRSDSSLGEFSEPFAASLSSMGAILGQSLAMLITLVAALLPWAALVGLLVYSARLVRRRMRRAQAEVTVPDGDE